MTKGRVLLADNNADFLDTCAEFLELANYQILRASNPLEAQEHLSEGWVHLAVLDLRLVNNDDDRDKSGLLLAKAFAPAVSKIILTEFPSHQDVRAALLPTMEGSPSVVDYVDKEAGLTGLLDAVEQAFVQHVRINSALVINLNESNPITFHHLANLIEPFDTGGRLLSRVEELEDLFRHLFFEKNQIRIDRLLWQRDGRAAVSVFAFAEGKATESLIVVCGRNARVMDEADRYRDYAPKAPGPSATVLVESVETTHFAANAYTLAGANLESVHSLAELYRSGPDRVFTAALKTLCERTLGEWHQQKRILEEHRTIGELYRERLGLGPDRTSKAAFRERVTSLVRQIPTLGMGIKRAAGKLTFSFGEQSFSYPDPLSVLYRSFDIGHPTLLMNTPGTLSGENIFSVDGDRAWVTDFAAAGPAPVPWNFVALEAAIRFDWIEGSKLRWIHDLEQNLLTNEFNKLDTSDIEAPLRKPMKAIRFIRMLAAKTSGTDSLSYNLGILFQAATRIAEFNPALRLTPYELARLAHVLIAATMICGHVVRRQRDSAVANEQKGPAIRIDKRNRVARVAGARVSLSPQVYDLLCNLYSYPNQLRTRRELVEQVLREKYDEMDKSQISRLNMAIHRLREKIEDDPENPRYLVTQPGGGYRLVTDPKE